MHSVFDTHSSLLLYAQESLVSTADNLLTVALRPLLTGLSEQLALQSSLLSQSTASLKTQVTQCWAVFHVDTFACLHVYALLITFLFCLQLQLQSHREFVSEFVSEQTHKIVQLNSVVQRENSQQVYTHRHVLYMYSICTCTYTFVVLQCVFLSLYSASKNEWPPTCSTEYTRKPENPFRGMNIATCSSVVMFLLLMCCDSLSSNCECR